MNIGEIIGDSLTYPLNNIKALLIYMVLGIILGLVMVFTGVGAVVAGKSNPAALIGIGAIGVIICVIIHFLIQGYMLDIINYGINKRYNAPDIEFGRNISNGIKLTIVQIVYFIIPLILTVLFGAIFRSWLASIIGIILFIIFAFAEFMGECRLANSDSLAYALSIGDAISDIFKVGILKIIITIIVVVIIGGIIYGILSYLFNFIPYLGGILTGILGVYLLFFINRSIGLLYSDAA